MAGVPFQVAGSSDWQWAKHEFMKSPLLLELEKPLTDATICSLKSAYVNKVSYSGLGSRPDPHFTERSIVFCL